MQDWDVLLAPWYQEPDPVYESEFTPWATPSWMAWNEQAVEVAVADFLGDLIRWLTPSLVIETGVGQGFITRRYDTPRLLFESDDAWRHQLGVRGLCEIEDGVTFSAEQARRADLTILDSTIPLRFAEMFLWFAEGKDGGWCFVHDTGTHHPPGSAYQATHGIAQSFRLPGIWLNNPRGSWLGRKGDISGEVIALWETKTIR